MTLLIFNILLMLLGPALIVGGLYGLAVVAGLPRRSRAHVYYRSARPARWAVPA